MYIHIRTNSTSLQYNTYASIGSTNEDLRSLLHLLYWAFTSCFLQTLVRSMESAPTLMEASAVPVFLLTLDHSVSTTARATPIPARRALFVLRQ